MKIQFPWLSGSKQAANTDCHIASGGGFICQAEGVRVTVAGRWGKESVVNLSSVFLSTPTLSFLPVMRWGQAEPLCIRLINSYSSPAWHPGNRSGFALGLIFRPADDSRSIRAPLRQCTANFPQLPEEAKGTGGENERLIERGIDDIEGWGLMGGCGEGCREIEKERKSERG